MWNCFSFYFYNKIIWQKNLQVPDSILADVSYAYTREDLAPDYFYVQSSYE